MYVGYAVPAQLTYGIDPTQLHSHQSSFFAYKKLAEPEIGDKLQLPISRGGPSLIDKLSES